MIRAEVHTDNHRGTASFDATKWFKQAAQEEIIDLAKVQWGGDYPADICAEYMEDHDQTVKAVFTYLETHNEGPERDRMGFECHIDPGDAARWLKVNRPNLWESLIEQKIVEGDEWKLPQDNRPYYAVKWG